MLHILATREGYQITERELSKIRRQNGWTLRTSNGMKSGKQKIVLKHAADEIQAPSLSPEVVAKRQARYEKLKAESEQRKLDKTRRVRTRGWAGLPADPPQDPRFPSEVTIGQSKERLMLSSATYTMMRDNFQAMCEENGVTKKTLAGSEKWQALKDQLIEATPELQAVLWVEIGDEITRKVLKDRTMALDVICSDVTKKIRTSKTRITIPDAKTSLGIDPAQGSEIRSTFYEILLADHFTSKYDAGQEHWEMLKAELVSKSLVLQEILALGDQDPEYPTKAKSLEVLCRDVMKRLRDDQTKVASKHKSRPALTTVENETSIASRSFNEVPHPETCELADSRAFVSGRYTSDSGPSVPNGGSLSREQSNDGRSNALASQTLASSTPSSGPIIHSHRDYSEIDPSLLAMPSQISIPDSSSSLNLSLITSFFCIASNSVIKHPPLHWQDTFSNQCSLAEFYAVGLSQHGQLGVRIARMQGHSSTLRPISIESEDTLKIFLQHASHETATVVIHLFQPMPRP